MYEIYGLRADKESADFRDMEYGMIYYKDGAPHCEFRFVRHPEHGWLYDTNAYYFGFHEPYEEGTKPDPQCLEELLAMPEITDAEVAAILNREPKQ